MADVMNSPSDVLIDLAHFEATDSSDGRLLHYAKGRIRTFWLRQTLTVFGALTVGLLSSGPLGVALAITALLGEGFDIALLRLVIHRLHHGLAGPKTRWIALVGGTVQGLTIAACVVLCWQVVPLHEARFFAAAFQIGRAHV